MAEVSCRVCTIPCHKWLYGFNPHTSTLIAHNDTEIHSTHSLGLNMHRKIDAFRGARESYGQIIYYTCPDTISVNCRCHEPIKYKSIGFYLSRLLSDNNTLIHAFSPVTGIVPVPKHYLPSHNMMEWLLFFWLISTPTKHVSGVCGGVLLHRTMTDGELYLR